MRNDTTKAHWLRLEKIGFISKQKYNRLTRCEGFSDDELAGFINRQLVETRQSTKAIAETLKELFPNTELVYSKAGNVSDFRQQFKLVKVRELNDCHHAEDAYLNIVVGNVYHTKFTRSPINFIKESKYKYSLKQVYNFDVMRANTTAWLAKPKDGDIEIDRQDGQMASIDIVRLTLQNKRMLFTRHAFEGTGEFYKQNPLKKGSGQIL